MRNIRRLQEEIETLENIFGYSNISYPADGSWLKICNFRLPQHKCRYNLISATILIIIPEEYDSAGISECYIDKDLRIRKGMRYEKLPHTHDRKYKGQGYQWLCFDASRSFVDLLSFINTLTLYFTEPFEYQRL